MECGMTIILMTLTIVPAAIDNIVALHWPFLHPAMLFIL